MSRQIYLNLLPKGLGRYFWQQLTKKVLPGLNRTLGVWEDDQPQVCLAFRPVCVVKARREQRQQQRQQQWWRQRQKQRRRRQRQRRRSWQR